VLALLASFDLTNGIIMFGWTTAIIMYRERQPEIRKRCQRVTKSGFNFSCLEL